MSFGRREDENDVVGRLFQRLEQRVERLAGQHVDFVDDVHFRAELRRCKLDALAQFSDLVDAAIAGRIDLHDVEGGALCDRNAGVAVTARVGARTVGLAVETLREDAGGGGLAGTARS